LKSLSTSQRTSTLLTFLWTEALVSYSKTPGTKRALTSKKAKRRRKKRRFDIRRRVSIIYQSIDNAAVKPELLTFRTISKRYPFKVTPLRKEAETPQENLLDPILSKN
jgi:hypothetical protein